MAKNPNRIRRIEFKFGDVIRKSNKAIRSAINEVAKEMQDKIVKSISTPYPPASTPGNRPHARRGKNGGLMSTTTVKAEGKKIVVRTTNVGVWLEGGTRKMAMRPFILPELQGKRKKWAKRLRAVIKRRTK